MSKPFNTDLFNEKISARFPLLLFLSGKSKNQAAKDAGMDLSALSKYLKGTRTFGMGTAANLMQSLGFPLVAGTDKFFTANGKIYVWSADDSALYASDIPNPDFHWLLAAGSPSKVQQAEELQFNPEMSSDLFDALYAYIEEIQLAAYESMSPAEKFNWLKNKLIP